MAARRSSRQSSFPGRFNGPVEKNSFAHRLNSTVASGLNVPMDDLSTRAPAPPSSPIHCIGDSHVSFFSGTDTIQPCWPERSRDRLPWFLTFHVGPALAFNLSRENTSTRGREHLFEVLDHAVPAGGRVLLCFGEIDCRAHVLKQAARRQTPMERIVADCLDSYFQAVREVIGRGFEVIVYNAVPTRLSTPRKPRRDDDFVAIGSWQERNAAVRCFNAGAKERCRETGARFLETYPELVDADGRTVEWYFHDAIHLSQRAMPVTLHALAALYPGMGHPFPLLRKPTSMQRAVDLLTKRVRRWLKLQPSRAT